MALLERVGDRLTLIRRTRSVAIVGMSADPSRPSHFVATYLLGETDWTVFFVNPHESRIMDRPVYASLADVPETPDLVDVFRRVDDIPSVTDEAIARGAPAIWFQLGLEHPAAAAAAARAGLDVVQNRCLKIEHARFAGGLHSAGFDTGVIDSRRTRLV